MVKKGGSAARNQKAKKHKKSKARHKVLVIGDTFAGKAPKQRESPDDDTGSDENEGFEAIQHAEAIEERSSVHREKHALRIQIKQTKLERLKLSKHNAEERKKKKELTKVLKALKEQASDVRPELTSVASALDNFSIGPPTTSSAHLITPPVFVLPPLPSAAGTAAPS